MYYSTFRKVTGLGNIHFAKNASVFWKEYLGVKKVAYYSTRNCILLPGHRKFFRTLYVLSCYDWNWTTMRSIRRNHLALTLEKSREVSPWSVSDRVESFGRFSWSRRGLPDTRCDISRRDPGRIWVHPAYIITRIWCSSSRWNSPKLARKATWDTFVGKISYEVLICYLQSGQVSPSSSTIILRHIETVPSKNGFPLDRQTFQHLFWPSTWSCEWSTVVYASRTNSSLKNNLQGKSRLIQIGHPMSVFLDGWRIGRKRGNKTHST